MHMDEWFENPKTDLPLRSVACILVLVSFSLPLADSSVVPPSSQVRWILDVFPKGGWIGRSRRLGNLQGSSVREDRAGSSFLSLALFSCSRPFFSSLTLYFSIFLRTTVLHYRAREVNGDVRGDGRQLRRILPVVEASLPGRFDRLGSPQQRRRYQVRR